MLDLFDLVRCIRWVKQHPLADKADVEHVWKACSALCAANGIVRADLRDMVTRTGGVRVDLPSAWHLVEPPALLAKEVLLS